MAQTQVDPVVLRPHQEEHFSKVCSILSKYYYYLDGSEPGTGKTHVACKVAKRLGLPILVVCPSVAKITWLQAFQMYGMHYWNIQNTGPIITYETFRSTKGCQPKHGLLARSDTEESPSFFPTMALAHIIRNGVFLVFDECQKIKNNNVAHKAIRAVIGFLMGGAGGQTVVSRAAFLSGTILDKEAQAIDFMRMTGFIHHRALYIKVGGEVRLEGIEELHTWARRIDPIATEDFIAANQVQGSRAKATSYAFQLFRQVIRPHIMSIMPKVIQRDTTGRPIARLDIKNGFYLLEQEEDLQYQDAVNELAGAVRFNARTGDVDQPQNSIGAVTKALMHIQISKISLATRLIRQALNETYVDAHGAICHNKVILYADYYEVIDRIKAELASYNPLELSGRVKDTIRPNVISAFNANTGDFRVLIAHPVVGGMSINLQDMTGQWRRKMFIMPGYRINELHQASLRTYRDGTIGDVYVRFIFGLTQQGNTELSILNALARKGKVMHQMLEEQRAKFPGEYEADYEIDPRTRFGNDFFTRNRILNPSREAGSSSDSDADDLVIDLAELDMSENVPSVNQGSSQGSASGTQVPGGAALGSYIRLN